MSTGLNCHIVEIETGEWFYILEDYSAPKMAWDWREHATAYGPFETDEQAWDHLGDNHANPGGAATYQADTRDDPVLAELVAKARERKERRRF